MSRRGVRRWAAGLTISFFLLTLTPALIASATVGAVVPLGTSTANPLPSSAVTALATELVGAGVTGVSGVQYLGAARAAGTFSGLESIINIDSGVVLSTGTAVGVLGPNENTCNTTSCPSQQQSADNLHPGDAQLATLAGRPTLDRASLQFSFIPTGDQVFFKYVFASEEYPEWVNSQYNDVFAFYVNNVNCATVGTAPVRPVSVNSINHTTNSDLYVDNVRTTTSQSPFDFEMDGFTRVLTCQAAVVPGVPNTIRLAIADATDNFVDSAVFIKAASFTTTPEASVEDETGFENEAVPLVGQVTDPDSPDPITAWSILSGGDNCVIADPAALETTISCPDDAIVTVQLSVDDGVSPVATATGTITVDNSNPELTIASPLANQQFRLLAGEALVELEASFSDLGLLDTHSCEINWDDSSLNTEIADATACDANHTYTEAGLYTLSVTVTDDDGGFDTQTVDFEVLANRNPIVTANETSVMVDEGSEAATTGTVSDLDMDPTTLSASIGVVVANSDGTWSWSYTPADGLNPVSETEVTITAEDDQDGTGQTTFDLLVNNVAPSVTITSPTTGQLFANSSMVVVSAAVVDPGVGDNVTCTIDWGAGPQAGTMADGVCSGGQQIPAPGVYTITVVATDKDGATGQAEVMVVVFGEGSVTGGGWINSPAGAYAADPTLYGKATFGFTSQYKKGATVPTGTSQFQFHAGNLNVHSVAYEWLVVNQGGANAQFKGTATVNGAATNAAGEAYQFMIWAGDGSPDTFRIKVWTENTGGESVIYDNGVQEALGGGSVVIHKLK